MERSKPNPHSALSSLMPVFPRWAPSREVSSLPTCPSTSADKSPCGFPFSPSPAVSHGCQFLWIWPLLSTSAIAPSVRVTIVARLDLGHILLIGLLDLIMPPSELSSTLHPELFFIFVF